MCLLPAEAQTRLDMKMFVAFLLQLFQSDLKAEASTQRLQNLKLFSSCSTVTALTAAFSCSVRGATVKLLKKRPNFSDRMRVSWKDGSDSSKRAPWSYGPRRKSLFAKASITDNDRPLQYAHCTPMNL